MSHETPTAENPLLWADVVVVSSSGGKDSQAIVDVVAVELEKLGRRDRMVVVHADMGRMEWKGAGELGRDVDVERWDPRGSTELAEAQAKVADARFEICRRRQGDLLAQVLEKLIWSRVGMGACQGTSDHKRGPIFTVYTKLADEWHAANPDVGRRIRILDVQGLARHEGGEGGKRDKRLRKLSIVPGLEGRIEENKKATNKRRREVRTWFPIADWTEAQVWERLEEAHELRGQPRPSWVYGAGMPRLSCAFCVFARREALNLAGQLDPVTLEAYVDVERKIGVPFRREFSLAEVQADIAAGRLASPADAANAWDDQA